MVNCSVVSGFQCYAFSWLVVQSFDFDCSMVSSSAVQYISPVLIFSRAEHIRLRLICFFVSTVNLLYCTPRLFLLKLIYFMYNKTYISIVIFLLGKVVLQIFFPFPPYTFCTACKVMCTFGDTAFIA